MFVIKYRKIFFIFTGVIVISAIFSIIFFGLNFGSDFTGGAITEISYETADFEKEKRLSKEALEERLRNLLIGGFSIRPTGDDSYILRTRNLTENERIDVMNALSFNGEKTVIQKRFNSIGAYPRYFSACWNICVFRIYDCR